ncbi:thioredoxin [Flavobacterium sp. N2820]|uniref:thioredoxin n=1 Tax=Flavobacterium sp. N2820 TaxID=2986834 RepID=UPI0022248439|nr:thioredoxin [Flavobacterium sp. N2820]
MKASEINTFEINKINHMNAKFKEVIQSNQLVLVDFYADWCGPCKMMSPILQEVKGIIKDDIKIIKINVDQHQDLASHFMVRGVPTLMLFKSGKMLWRQSGVLSTKDLVAIIQNQLN